MKTIKIKLLTTIITIAAITAVTTISASAQRRDSKSNTKEARTERTEKDRKETVQRKSTFKEVDSRPGNTTSNRVESNRGVKTKSGSTVTRERQSGNNPAQKSPVVNNQNRDRRTSTSPQTTNRNRNTVSEKNGDRNNQRMETDRSRNYPSGKPENRYTNRNTERLSKNKSYNQPAERRTTGNDALRTNSRNTPSRAREIYRHDDNDRRYTPNNNYKGSDRYWSNNYRPGSMNYNHNDRNFYRDYDYRKHNHWDRNWESYRWNSNSWREYYSGYNPYSYRYHKYYFHHPVYGHVIRRFGHQPNIFIHNHYKYYCYDGHFFRFHRGIGYVLVDIPFGIAFERLPYGYERVYINGYLYFRLGNLFFELSDYGYRLVHYPERYFAYDDGYHNEGYYFDDDIYY